MSRVSRIIVNFVKGPNIYQEFRAISLYFQAVWFFFLYNQLCIWIMGCALVHTPSASKRLKGYFSSIIINNRDYVGISRLIIHFDIHVHLRPHGSNLRSYLHVLCKEFGKFVRRCWWSSSYHRCCSGQAGLLSLVETGHLSRFQRAFSLGSATRTKWSGLMAITFSPSWLMNRD